MLTLPTWNSRFALARIFQTEARIRFMSVAAVALLSSVLAAQTPDLSSGSSKTFAKLSEEFIHDSLALSPANASQAGYHLHIDPKSGKTVALDALLDDMSEAGIAEQRRVYVH